jgi:hypothetical protein
MNKLSKQVQIEIADHLSALQRLKVYVIISICGYCGELLGVKDGEGINGLSHGICGECKLEMMKGKQNESKN